MCFYADQRMKLSLVESGFCLNFKHQCETVFGGTQGVLFVCVFEFRQVVLENTRGVRFLSELRTTILGLRHLHKCL